MKFHGGMIAIDEKSYIFAPYLQKRFKIGE